MLQKKNLRTHIWEGTKGCSHPTINYSIISEKMFYYIIKYWKHSDSKKHLRKICRRSGSEIKCEILGLPRPGDLKGLRPWDRVSRPSSLLLPMLLTSVFEVMISRHILFEVPSSSVIQTGQRYVCLGYLSRRCLFINTKLTVLSRLKKV